MAPEYWFLGAGIALCLFSLWAIGRNDWVRAIRPGRKVLGEVTGHRESWENSSRSYAAIYAFSDETGRHEAIDAVYHSAAQPPVGTLVELSYPEGRPELARPPRPLLWAAVYGLLLGMLGILLAKAAGWLT